MANNRKQGSFKEQPFSKPQLNVLYGLKDIGLLVYERKISIILIVLGVLAAAVLYSISIQPIYRATANVVPPLDTRVSTLNVSGCSSWSGEEIFQVFRKHILDPSRRETFFKQPKVLKLTQTLESKIKVGIDFDKNDRLTLHLDGASADLIEVLAGQYISMNEKTATKQVLSETIECLNVRERILNEAIAVERIATKEKVKHDIQNLEDARDIAEEIGNYEFDPRAPAIPLFARGVKALDAEIRTLRSKAMTDAAIDTLSPAIVRDKNELRNIERLKGTNTWSSSVISAQVQSEPYADPEPIFPKHPIIWIYGLIIGLLVSLFYAISMNKIRMIQKNRT